MSNELQIPSKPWGDAEIAFLTAHQNFLPEDVKVELGFTPVEPVNDFRANTDSPSEETVVAPTEEVAVASEEDVVVAEEGLPTEVDGVVDNEGGDNA